MNELSCDLNEVYFAEFERQTDEGKQQPFQEFVVHSDDVYVSHPGSILVYFNASQYLSPIGLCDRYQRGGRPLTPDEQRQIENEWLGLNHESLKESICGTELKWKVHLIAEGQLARLALSTRDLRKSFGFLEGWLCCASRVFDARALKPLFDFLPQLYLHAKQVKEALDSEGRGTAHIDIKFRADVLYTRLAALLTKTRESAPAGCYKFRNEDFNWTKLIDPMNGDRLVMFPDRDGKVVYTLLQWYGSAATFRGDGGVVSQVVMKRKSISRAPSPNRQVLFKSTPDALYAQMQGKK